MTESPITNLRELITFRVAEQYYSVDIMSVREIRGWSPATPLPHSPNYVRGVINLRGAVLPIVDMAARLGLPDAEPSQRHVIIVVWIAGRLVGLLVDAVCDIITVDEDALQATPDVACDGVPGFIQGLLTVDDRLTSLVSLDQVLPLSDFGPGGGVTPALDNLLDNTAVPGDLVGGEFPFTQRDFHTIARMLHTDVGIALTETKAPLVYARLVKRLRTLGLQSFKDYCALVGTKSGAEERRRMTAALTTNITRFFREPHHFDFLKTRQLPVLLDRARRGGRVRLWSAGCSSGEEAYSIALTILEAEPDAHNLDIKILATDIDHEVLARARAGLYSDAAVGPIDRELRSRWLSFEQGAHGEREWCVGPELRQLVAFRELNLIGRWPMRGPFQAIFCRNVTIYFEEDVQVQVWRQMGPMLAAGGCFYIGHSERILGIEGFRSMGMTVYQRIGEELS